MDDIPFLYKESDRRKSILSNTPGKIYVAPNPNADIHYHELRALDFVGTHTVLHYEKMVEHEAQVQGVDPDLVKAIMYVENAQGAYGYLSEAVNYSDSILPMNIKRTVWKELVPGGDFSDPYTNIHAGVTLIKRIQDRLDDPSPEKIATLYNALAKDSISDYGARVGNVMETKPWDHNILDSIGNSIYNSFHSTPSAPEEHPEAHGFWDELRTVGDYFF